MATRLFFRNEAALPAADAPTAGEKSTALPNGTANGTSPTSRLMSPVKTATQTSAAVTTLAQTARQSGTVLRFVSNRLAAQTINANTWTFFSAADESNAAANAFSALSIYVWNPAGSSVRGFIYDNVAELGTEFSTSQSAQSLTVSGSAVTAVEGDFLVCEWWYTAAQGMGTAYTVDFFYGGTDETTTGTGNTSTATYLETPQDLILRLPKSSVIFIM